jgi:uncharacterized membrane protein YobD (UPF0266 family)
MSNEPEARPNAGLFHLLSRPEGAIIILTAMKFNKRTFKNPGEFFGELWFALRHMRRLKAARNKGLVPTAFRERLMLAVTAVNGCRIAPTSTPNRRWKKAG